MANSSCLPLGCPYTAARGALLAAGLALTLAAAAQPPVDSASAPAAVRSEQARALQRCEVAVVDTLRKMRGAQAQDVHFVPGERVVTPGDETDVNVKGAGRYGPGSARASSGSRFSFSCTFNPKTDLASGVVVRDAATAVAAAREAAWQPDLSRVSPEACESAAAQLLKNKHPRVATIAFEPDTRRLQPGPDDHLLLLGQGAVQRAPGMHAIPFSYSCEIEPRSGRLLGVKTSS